MCSPFIQEKGNRVSVLLCWLTEQVEMGGDTIKATLLGGDLVRVPKVAHCSPKEVV